MEMRTLYIFDNLRSASVETLSLFMITFHFLISWYIMNNLLAFHVFFKEFFSGELYKTFYTHCLIWNHGPIWGRGTICCLKRPIMERFFYEV